jgi:hypothetical protein
MEIRFFEGNVYNYTMKQASLKIPQVLKGFLNFLNEQLHEQVNK